MASHTGDNGDALDIAAEIVALRKRVDLLLDRGSIAAAEVAGDVRQTTIREVDTLVAQARAEPLATAVFVLGGAILGFLLGRAVR